jgi:hypothetical protein
MKSIAFLGGMLALGIASATAARADVAVVMFKDGSCKPWVQSGVKPLQSGWKYHWVGLKSWEAAEGKKHYAVAHKWCKTFN